MSESEKEKALARLKTLSKESQIAVLLAAKEAKQEKAQEQSQDKPLRSMKSLERKENLMQSQKKTLLTNQINYPQQSEGMSYTEAKMNVVRQAHALGMTIDQTELEVDKFSDQWCKGMMRY